MILRHFGLYTNRIEELSEFYGHFGFEKIYDNLEDWPGVFGRVHIIKMRIKSGGILEILNFLDREDFDWTSKNSHVCFTVENISSVKIALETKGVQFFVTVKESPDASVMLAFCKDPIGTVVEIVQEKPHEIL